MILLVVLYPQPLRVKKNILLYGKTVVIVFVNCESIAIPKLIGSGEYANFNRTTL
jgi:hypothetical protein